ncbi:Lysine-specific demethylase 4 [Cytospora mali]|uniref:Lysine-specific demethylase 4 n=1 Tax=Cytospora mali TaxID=578113 RepID=A0A194VI72_CYTMA|nr:Lysine-specific demethylase 4 [Valsa mali]
MALLTQPAELSQKVDALRNEILRKLEVELGVLKTTIVREVDSHASGNRRQTRHGKSARKVSSAKPLLETIMKNLADFAEEFLQDLDTRFSQCFSMIPASDRNGRMTDDPVVSSHAEGRVAASDESTDEPTNEPTARITQGGGSGVFMTGEQLLETERHLDPFARRGRSSNNQRGPSATSEHDPQTGDQGVETTSSDALSVSTSTTGKSSTKTPLAEVDTALESTRCGRESGSSINRANTTANGILPPEEQFCLTTPELGERLIPSLMKMMKQDGFAGKITIQNIGHVDWADLGRTIKPAKKYDFQGVVYTPGSSGKGISHLHLSPIPRRFRSPDFSQPVDKPSQRDIDKYLEDLTSTPPTEPISYYVGPPISPAFNSLLHPGSDILQLGPIPGVTELYWHAGNRGSGTAFHCEDASFRSCNLTLFGWKLWILIRESHTDKFEAWIKRQLRAGSCDQFVRHCNVLISPARLQAEGIGFDIQCAGPGQMVITAPRQYHAVVNLTACFAIAINFLLPGEQVRHWPLCEDCGLYTLDYTASDKVHCPQGDNGSSVDTLTHRPRSTSRPSRVRTSATTASPAPTQRTALPDTRKRKPKPLYMIESKRPKHTISPARMAASLVSASSVRRFMTHISMWRVNGVSSKKEEFNISGRQDERSWDARAAWYYRLGEKLGNSSSLTKLLFYIVQIQLAETIQKQAVDLGYQNATCDMIEAVLQKLGIAVSTTTRSKFQALLRFPRRLMKILGPHRSLLSFLPFDEDGSAALHDYRHILEDDFSTFQANVQANKDASILAKAGRLFEESILHCMEFPDMLWERINAEELDKLPLEYLTQLLNVKYRNENAQ